MTTIPSARTRGLLASLAASCLLALTVGTTTMAQSEGTGKKPDRAAEKEKRAEEQKKKAEDREKAKRFEKLDAEDRAALEAAVGYVAPEFTSSLDWLGNEAPSMKGLRGKVVVIQTFTTKNAGARALPERTAKALSEFAGQVQVIAIHTPEGADKAANMLKKGELAAPTAIDMNGDFCDLIGAYKKPVNVVVDKTGDVRYAGLTPDGLVEVCKELAAQEYDPANKPTERPKETMATGKDFPTFTTPVQSAIDMRGKPAPALPNVKWEFGAPPRPNGQLLVIDFWATWCGPCRQAIPHMNEIAKGTNGTTICMGISDESVSNFEKGLKDHSLKRSDFEYAVGTDPTGSMKKAFGISGIPHCVIISSDGIVRWQGHPMSLDPATLNQLLDANKALNARTGAGGGAASNRWKRDGDVNGGKGDAKKRRG